MLGRALPSTLAPFEGFQGHRMVVSDAWVPAGQAEATGTNQAGGDTPCDWLVSRIDLLFQHCWKIPLSTTTVVPPVECPHERRLDRVAEAEDGKIRMGRRGWAIEVFPKPKGPHKTQRSYSPQNLFFCSI